MQPSKVWLSYASEAKLSGFRMARSKKYQFQENKRTRNQTKMANWKRKVCFFRESREATRKQGAKNGRTEKDRNVKEYHRVVYSKCREDGA